MRDSWTGARMQHEECGDFVLSEDYDAIAARLALYDALVLEAARIQNARYDPDDMQRLVDALAELAPPLEPETTT